MLLYHRSDFHKLNSKRDTDIAIHGLLLWASVGFLMPLGILVIRMSIRSEGNSSRARVLFYVHVILQILSVLLATAGAILSVKSFENSFNNHHQRIGLFLYGVIWVQAIVGLLRPRRGTKRRTTWYIVHWLLGTAISLLGIINIYTGILAYHDKTSRGTWIWTTLFTAQLSLIAFLYLFIDKWDYLHKQGSDLESDPSSTSPPPSDGQAENHKQLMVLEPCGKANALKNLFD